MKIHNPVISFSTQLFSNTYSQKYFLGVFVGGTFSMLLKTRTKDIQTIAHSMLTLTLGVAFPLVLDSLETKQFKSKLFVPLGIGSITLFLFGWNMPLPFKDSLQ